MPKHDAFLSFNHAADGKLAGELSAELERFAKPWYQLRARRIFQDAGKISLAAQDAIREAIQVSGYFILIASPASASSDWVRHELTAWIQSRPDARERIRIVLSDGEIVWNEALRRFRELTHLCSPEMTQGF